MFSFLFRIAIKSAIVQKYRFISLTLTIAVASALLIILSALYFNAESQLAYELSGVPNIVVKPKKSIVTVSKFNITDVLKLKSEEHFWRNNIVNAVPVMLAEGEIGENKIKIAGTWFKKEISYEDTNDSFGILEFEGWSYKGEKPDSSSVIVGANVDGEEKFELKFDDLKRKFKVAGVLKTGSFWDDYVFLELKRLKKLIGKDRVDQILVSTMIKPKDEVAVKAERYGIESLSDEEYEKWYCSPYASTVAYTIKEVIPHSKVKILRRITEVQEGIITRSSDVFMAMFVLTMVVSITTIFSAEKMYTSSKTKEYGIMSTLGSSTQKVFLQLITEISMASLLAAGLSYLLSRTVVEFISNAVFGIRFQANSSLLVASTLIPFFMSFLALIFVKRKLNRNVVEILR